MDTNHSLGNTVSGQVTSIMQSTESQQPPDKSTVLAVLQLLRKYNLKGTEESLLREANLNLDIGNQGSESEVNTVLSAYKSEGNPEFYEEAYTDLKRFVEGALDTYKHELGMVLYPVFVHMYLELVYNGHEIQAVKFMEKFSGDQEIYYQDDLKKLAQVTKKDQMKGNELTETFKSNEFIIRMSRDTLTLLKRHLQEKKHSVLLNIIQEHLYFDMYEGVARNKQQIDATAGAVVGEATRQGITCLQLATKNEEVYPPKMAEYAYVTDGACSESEIIAKELVICKALDWRLNPVTPLYWLKVLLQVCYHGKSRHDLGFFFPQFSAALFGRVVHLLNLCTLDVGSLRFSYSVLAAAALYLAFNAQLALQVSGLAEEDLSPCVDWMMPFWEVLKEEVPEYVKKYNKLLPGFTKNTIHEDEHNYQKHNISLSMLDAALSEVARRGPSSCLLTPPSSSKKSCSVELTYI